MKRVAPLDYLTYNASAAESELSNKFGWERYKNKHYENIFTRFYEGYYLPKKFGYDKRKCYFSNLILTGQMSREEALKQLEQPPYDENSMQDDLSYIAKKLGLSREEFEKLINGANRTFSDYKNSYKMIGFLMSLARFSGVENRAFR